MNFLTKEINEDVDLIYIMHDANICSDCAKYHDRIYSQGNDERFPLYQLFGDYIATKSCTCIFTPYPFFYGLSVIHGYNKEDTIVHSNRPF